MTWRYPFKDGPPESEGIFACTIMREDHHVIVGLMTWDGENFSPTLGDFAGAIAVTAYHPVSAMSLTTLQ